MAAPEEGGGKEKPPLVPKPFVAVEAAENEKPPPCVGPEPNAVLADLSPPAAVEAAGGGNEKADEVAAAPDAPGANGDGDLAAKPGKVKEVGAAVGFAVETVAAVIEGAAALGAVVPPVDGA